MTSLSVVAQMKDFPILIIIGVAFIVGILVIIIKYADKKTITPRSNSPSASAKAEDLISVKEEFQK